MEKNQIKIHCSQIGKIMTSPRSGGGLSETAKSHVKEIFLDREFGIRKEFWSRYTDKGNRVEHDSIRLANRVLDWGLTEERITAKQERYSNDYIVGRMDVLTDWMLADIKSSWDGTTFPWFTSDIPNKDYFYQLQGYMWLTGHTTSSLVYCLTNTPEDMISDEIRRELWKNKVIGDDDEIEEFVRAKHEFGRIPEAFRVKEFIVERDDLVIEKIIAKVNECRDYYETLYDIIK